MRQLLARDRQLCRPGGDRHAVLAQPGDPAHDLLALAGHLLGGKQERREQHEAGEQRE